MNKLMRHDNEILILRTIKTFYCIVKSEISKKQERHA